MVASEDLECDVLDFTTAFLNGLLQEDIYIEAPSHIGIPGKALKLNKALYGLKQAPREWYKTLKKALVAQGFEVSLIDGGLSKLTKRGSFALYVLLYVDDLLMACKDKCFSQHMKNMLLNTFRGKDKGGLYHYLGNLIHRDRSEKCLYLDQRHFVKTLLYKAGMETAHGKYIPIQKEALSEVPSNGLEDDQSANFRSIVGALLHVSTTSRPDIAYAVGRLSRHMKEPAERHLDQAKYLLRYMKTAQDFVSKLGGPGDLHGRCMKERSVFARPFEGFAVMQISDGVADARKTITINAASPR
jgi:hypothetical protein